MKYRYQAGDTVYEVVVEGHGQGYRVTIDGETREVQVLDVQPGAITLRFDSDGASIRPRLVHWGADGETKWLSSGGCSYRLERPRERRRGASGPVGGDKLLRAPMPAQVRAVQVGEGEDVAAGQTLLLLEAMKMEIKLTSPRAGRVKRVMAQTGQTVERDQVLIELE